MSSAQLTVEKDLRKKEPLRVLFICTGNSARSQIAEALVRQMSKGRIEVLSAGSEPDRRSTRWFAGGENTRLPNRHTHGHTFRDCGESPGELVAVQGLESEIAA